MVQSTSRKHRHRRLRSTRIEFLEFRQLLAGDPIISEFLASNRGTLDDGKENSSDWIEIQNAGDALIDLHPWYLTDDPEDLTKWRFPDQPQAELEPGDLLVVFASGDDQPDPAGNLHTNFRLSAGGEYLALVMPDGQTVKSEFAAGGTDYPEQFRNISYGIGQDLKTVDILGTGSPAHSFVPDAESDALYGTSWQGGDERPALLNNGRAILPNQLNRAVILVTKAGTGAFNPLAADSLKLGY